MKTVFNFILGAILMAMFWIFWTCLWTAVYELALK